MKKYLSYILAVVLFVGCFVIPTENVSAGTGPIKYWLDMGVQQVWSNPDGTWTEQVKPGDTIDVKSTIQFSNPVEIVGYYTVGACKFNFGDTLGTYNYNRSKLIFDNLSYQDSYGQYKANQITPVSATASGNNVTISYKAMLRSENPIKEFNLAELLRKGEAKTGYTLWTLLGGDLGKENVKKYTPEIYEKWQNAYDEGLNDTIQAYLYFTPTVIAYREILVCKTCELCLLNSGTNCSKESCPVFKTAECGCYAEEVVQVTPPADTAGSCTDVIKWSEKQSHTYKCSGCKTRKTASGSKKKYCPGHTCNHVYTYQSKLNSVATLKAVKPNGNNTTFKSGYGFTVNVDSNIATSQISNSGACGKSLSKANDKKPTPPLSAEVKTNWIVKLKDSKVTQPKTVILSKSASTATTSKFVTAPNKLSPKKNAQIYTDVALKGTKQKPVKHTITAYTYGGGVNGVQFCKSIPLTFTINGNMYEDDWTVDGMSK